MKLFNIHQYELPPERDIDWNSTKHRLSLFLSAYKVSREKCRLSVLPKIAIPYYLLADELDQVDVGKVRVEEKEEFSNLSRIFTLGYVAIMHPIKSEITERRRKVFMLRYLYGLSVDLISERIHYQKNVIVDESKMAIIQFCHATSLLVIKK